MKVKELIELLSKQNQEGEVLFEHGDGAKQIGGVTEVPLNKPTHKSKYRWFPIRNYQCKTTGVVIHSDEILFPTVKADNRIMDSVLSKNLFK